MAPVLEGSGSGRRHQRKGTCVDRVCVVSVARVDNRIFCTFNWAAGGRQGRSEEGWEGGCKRRAGEGGSEEIDGVRESGSGGRVEEGNEC